MVFWVVWDLVVFGCFLGLDVMVIAGFCGFFVIFVFDLFVCFRVSFGLRFVLGI